MSRHSRLTRAIYASLAAAVVSFTGTATRSFRRSGMRGDRTASIARYRRKPVLNARSSRGVTRRATLSRSRSPRPHQSPERSSIRAA